MYMLHLTDLSVKYKLLILFIIDLVRAIWLWFYLKIYVPPHHYLQKNC